MCILTNFHLLCSLTFTSGNIITNFATVDHPAVLKGRYRPISELELAEPYDLSAIFHVFGYCEQILLKDKDDLAELQVLSLHYQLIVQDC